MPGWLVHLVDVSGSEGRDPVADFDAINTELKEYSPELAQRPMIVCGNKADLLFDRPRAEALKAHAEALATPTSSSPPPPIRGSSP